ncbi:hypothetical protein EV368DRAFT_3967, partial [Lentinula lateritia]
EHADDMVLITRSALSLQRHLTTFEDYCHNDNLTVSAGKSWVMLFGHLPPTLPTLRLAGSTLPFKDAICYVGIQFQSSHRHLFAAHYTTKHDAAVTAAGGITGCELIIGHQRLDPSIAKQLYSALVDCHLINGCEVIIDTDNLLISMLEQVQLICLHRLLGLSRRSMTTPLFTKTGVMPIRARRVILALRYLIYLINLPRNHYASLALHENHNMRASGIPCWLSDLDWVIQHLPGCSLSLPPLPNISEEIILTLIKSITSETNSRLQTEIDYSNRLALLQHCLEPQKTGPNKLITHTLRHYLTQVYKSHHRLSLTRLLCGDMVPITFHSSPARTHSLNLGENQSKRCRACLSPLQPESPQHVLLQCTA